MLVDRVFYAILGSQAPSGNTDQDISESEGSKENDDSLIDPDEPDDSMTLDQCQDGLRNEALVRRVPQ